MNKKLFSWKALAGFALLAAISMTSCTNTDDPIDPLNPNQQQVTPIAIVDGDYDVVLNNITKTADVATAWANVPAATKTAIDKKDSVNVAINVNSYELDGVTMNLPAFFSAPDKKIVNVYFIGNFAKQTNAAGARLPMIVNADTNLKGAKVYFHLYTSAFWFNLTAQKVRPFILGLDETLGSELVRLDVKSNTGQDAMKIMAPVKVDAVNCTDGEITVDSKDQLDAKLITANETLVEGQGAQVGALKLYLKKLYVISNATIAKSSKATLDKITIAPAVVVTLGDKKSTVKAVEGLGTGANMSTIQLAGDKDDLSKIESLKNVIVKSGTATNLDDITKFEDCVFNADMNLKVDSVAGNSFQKNFNITVDDDSKDKIFEGVDFSLATTFDVESDVEYTRTYNNVLTMYEVTPDGKTYAHIANNNPAKRSAANQEYSPKDIYQTVIRHDDTNWINVGTTNNPDWRSIGKWSAEFGTSIDFDGTKFYVKKLNYSTLKAALDAASKAYDTVYNNQGSKAAYESAEYTSYTTAFANLYGMVYDNVNTPAKVAQDKYGKANLTFDVTNAAYLNSVYENTLLERRFCDTVNPQIAGSYWFVIYFTESASMTVEPGVFDIYFNNCTVNGKAMTFEQLQDKFDSVTDFSSVAEAWYNVYFNGEKLSWRKVIDGPVEKYILWK